MFANDYIDKKNMTVVPGFIAFEKTISEELYEDLFIMSHLDFPSLTHVPRRQGTEEAEGDHGNAKKV